MPPLDAEGLYVPPLPTRANGLGVLVGIVALGLLSGAGYFFYKQPRMRAQTEAAMDAAPTTPEGQLAFGFDYLKPQIHNRLLSVRISRQQPWIATHTVHVPSAEGPPEVWGIDIDALGQNVAHVDGLDVVIDLPEPTLLARTTLIGDKARDVPAYSSAAPIPDPVERLRFMVAFFFEQMAGKLSDDIEGARLVVEIGGRRLPL